RVCPGRTSRKRSVPSRPGTGAEAGETRAFGHSLSEVGTPPANKAVGEAHVDGTHERHGVVPCHAQTNWKGKRRAEGSEWPARSDEWPDERARTDQRVDERDGPHERSHERPRENERTGERPRRSAFRGIP